MVDQATLQPQKGVFDTSEIVDFILGLPFAFRDPADPQGPFCVPGDQVAADYARDVHLKEHRYPYGICLISVSPEKIEVALLCDGKSLEHAQQFLEWLTARCKCRISDDWGNDLTESCADSLDALYIDVD